MKNEPNQGPIIAEIFVVFDHFLYLRVLELLMCNFQYNFSADSDYTVVMVLVMYDFLTLSLFLFDKGDVDSESENFFCCSIGLFLSIDFFRF